MEIGDRARRLLVGALALVAVVCAGCTSSAQSLRVRQPASVGANQIVDGSYTAAVTGRRVTLMIPSGRVDLVLTAPRHAVAAQDVRGAKPLVAAKGHALVGVSWVLQRAAYPDAPNRQPLEPSAIFGPPQPTRLWLVADGTRTAIPRVGPLAAPYGRPADVVWISVPAQVRAWSFALSYDGVTQTVDGRTGKVAPGRAAPLYRTLPLEQRGTCHVGSANFLGGCLTKSAVGYPYVDGGGWAPAGHTWLLLQVYIDDDSHAARHVTLAGTKPSRELGDAGEPFSPFLVSSRAASLPLRGMTKADDLYRGTVTTTVTANVAGLNS